MSTTTANVPNPYTPMAWVPPELEMRLAHQLYATVGSLAVLLWDILLHIPQDYTMMTKKPLNISSAVYVIARLSGLVYVLSFAIVETAPIGNCDYIRRVSFLFSVALPSTFLLLVFRVVALYKNNKFITAFFALSWLAVLAICIVVPFGMTGVQITNTPYCVEIRLQPHSIVGVIGPGIHDTFIFLATTWVFVKNSYTETNLKNSFNIVVLGRSLPAFSKSLLRDGQFYFLTSTMFNIFYVILFFTSQSFIARCTLALPSFVLFNAMACHLYRNVRLGLYRDHTLHTEAFQGALEGSSAPSNQQHQMGVAFSRERSSHSTHLTQEIDLEAARDDSNFASREKVDVAEPGYSKESITEKAEV